MKIKQTILVFALLIGIGGFLMGNNTVYAEAGDPCGTTTLKAGQSCCGGVVTSVISCTETGGENADIQQSGVWGLIKLIYTILSVGVGVAAVGGIIYASILYASAGDSSEQTKKSISVIINVAIGLVAYALMSVFLNFILPGGLDLTKW